MHQPRPLSFPSLSLTLRSAGGAPRDE
ncbi:hypothetical protein E2C01_090069 [Portunus trituberculatus]|uniref:Uncharacterized protein n=1 Tax=Portunus trituberculatus TaxID=210409 RepID=A0A5B7JDQ3_PORTR|nr:hypothetical protein [Portunus trituberculatus]